jgi:uncharacterized membrane protein YdjX (TVP38/TMEM64 family)
MKRELTTQHKKWIAGAGIAVFVLLTAAVCIFIGRPMLRFVSEPEKFRLWVSGHGVWGALAYVGMMILQVFVAIIPGEPLEIGGGYAFGAVGGTLLCMAGAAIGSLLVFLFVRRFGRAAVEIFFPREKIDKLKFLQESPKRNLIFLMIYIVPGTPKDLLCYFAGLTDMKLSYWLMLCTLGRFPSVVTSTVGGDALGMGNYTFAIIVFAVTIVLSVGGLLLYQNICKKQEEQKHD